MSTFLEFKRRGGVLEVEVDTDGSIEIDYRDVPHRAYISQDCRHYFDAAEVAQIVAALPQRPAPGPSHPSTIEAPTGIGINEFDGKAEKR